MTTLIINESVGSDISLIVNCVTDTVDVTEEITSDHSVLKRRMLRRYKRYVSSSKIFRLLDEIQSIMVVVFTTFQFFSRLSYFVSILI